jgi:hypothetical protein
MCVEYYKELKDRFPVPHEILQDTNLNEVIVKKAEGAQSKTKQMTDEETMKCQNTRGS